MDECDELREMTLRRKAAQNLRREKKGLTPRHKISKPASAPSRAKKPPPAESGDENDTAMSFEEWKNAGWCVRKGERSQLTDILGVPQFTRSQVRKNNPAWESFRGRK